MSIVTSANANESFSWECH